MNKTLHTLFSNRSRDERGATVVLVAVLLVVIVAMAALAIDISHLYLVRNELQNAADAGALAGARVLYLGGGIEVNPDANQEAFNAARDNSATTAGGALAVDVNWTAGNTGDVQRGHWSFGLGSLEKGFYANASLAPTILAGVSTEDLDENLDFINAVRVVARRETTPAASFFARLFGYQDFALQAEAVAYLGFAGTLRPADVEIPIAICEQAITDDDDTVTCNTGRMINSGGGTTHNTAAWTNFTQPCETANSPTISPLLTPCGSGNPNELNLGAGIGATGGMVDNVYNTLRDCWRSSTTPKDWRGYPTERWTKTLPVIDCPGNNPSTCPPLRGAVTVDFIWVKESGTDSGWLDVPMQMEDWECEAWANLGRPMPTRPNGSPPNHQDWNDVGLTEAMRQECWGDFAQHFGLVTADDTSVGDLTPSDLNKTMFFLPDCEPQEPRGITGGENFGILAEIPVLVK